VENFSLDIIGNEWIIIIFVGLILLLGTKRLPEVSRKIGKFMGEYNKTRNVVQNEFQRAKSDFIPVQGPATTERQKLETMAKSLGIDSTNRSDDELRNLINSKFGGSANEGTGSPSN
jgi:sec-independent protein translocase protein TatA